MLIGVTVESLWNLPFDVNFLLFLLQMHFLHENIPNSPQKLQSCVDALSYLTKSARTSCPSVAAFYDPLRRALRTIALC